MGKGLESLLNQLNISPESVEFHDVMEVIENGYTYKPSAFKNGSLVNSASENEGSCKIFAFAKVNKLSEEKTLALFGAYYRDDVLGQPDGDNHQNIRNFMNTGWSEIEFEGDVLVPKKVLS